jgi:hypothetical protein
MIKLVLPRCDQRERDIRPHSVGSRDSRDWSIHTHVILEYSTTYYTDKKLQNFISIIQKINVQSSVSLPSMYSEKTAPGAGLLLMEQRPTYRVE